MKESKRLGQILAKYKLTSPVPFFKRRKILKSKRKILVKILKSVRYDSAFVSAAVYLSDLFNRLGFRLSLAGGARVFAGAAVFSLFIIFSSSLALVYNYGRVSQFIIALTGIGVQEYRKGYVLAARGELKIIRDDKELPALKAKDRLITRDEIVTGADGTIVFQLEKKTLVRVIPETTVNVEIDLKVKSIVLRQGTVLCNVQDMAKDEKFNVTTLNARVFVTGTQFSVTYENRQTTITVIKGAVQAVNLMTNETIQVDAGKTAVIAGEVINLKDAEEAERIILQKFGKLEYMNNVIDKSDKEMNDFAEAVLATDRESEEQKEDEIKIRTLEDIKRKYGKLEEVQLYNGQRYTGAIISRGGIYSFITVKGIKKIPAKDVKNVRIIK
ncbi:MAG: FecR family protein [Spirochaetota bacterium]